MSLSNSRLRSEKTIILLNLQKKATMLQREQIDYLLVYAYNAAIRAGARILEIYGSDDFFVNIKADNTPVTLADRDSHAIIKKHLGQTRIPLMSEEGRDLLYEERCNWDLFWLVDPLDGTKEFIRRESHEFTVNIALMVDHKPFIGIIYAPYFRKMYFCDMERGSFLKKEVAPDTSADFTITQIYEDAEALPLVRRKNTPLRIAVSRFHKSPETDAAIASLREKYGELELVETGSSLKI